MGFYDDAENVQQYIDMAKGYDGRELIQILSMYLEPGSRVLEIGSGPGVDLQLLTKDYQVTGSDNSRVFRDRYLSQHPQAPFLLLDAKTLETDNRFHCIYSNKVLHHLNRDELQVSLTRQEQILETSALVLHSFWKGQGEERIQGMLFTYWQVQELKDLFSGFFEVIRLETYTEMEEGDSLLVLARKKSP